MKAKTIINGLKKQLVRNYNNCALAGAITEATHCIINAGCVKGVYIASAALYVTDSFHTNDLLVEYACSGKTLQDALLGLNDSNRRNYYN